MTKIYFCPIKFMALMGVIQVHALFFSMSHIVIFPGEAFDEINQSEQHNIYQLPSDKLYVDKKKDVGE